MSKHYSIQEAVQVFDELIDYLGQIFPRVRLWLKVNKTHAIDKLRSRTTLKELRLVAGSCEALIRFDLNVVLSFSHCNEKLVNGRPEQFGSVHKEQSSVLPSESFWKATRTRRIEKKRH